MSRRRRELELFPRPRKLLGREVDVSATFNAQASELFGLVAEPAVADELGIRIICRSRLRALAAGDRQALLRQVRAGEVVRQVGRGKDDGAVVESVHSS